MECGPISLANAVNAALGQLGHYPDVVGAGGVGVKFELLGL